MSPLMNLTIHLGLVAFKDLENIVFGIFSLWIDVRFVASLVKNCENVIFHLPSWQRLVDAAHRCVLLE